MKLQEVCSYVADKIDNSALNIDNYISTENMMQNCGGITSASNVPVGKSTRFIEGDILFSNIRPYFKKLWRANISGGCSADVLCIRANEKIDPTYLYYLLTQDSFISYVMAGTKGCKMPRGDKQYNMAWNINLPSLDVQVKIAAQLSEIDDKIAVNRSICENLEAQAQALFKHWFIDFAPFKNGKFVESELGMIPEGWRVGTLKDILKDIETGKRPKGGAQVDGIPSIGAEKIEKISCYNFSSEKYISKEFFENMTKGKIKSGDVLLYKDGAYTGKSTLFMNDFPYSKCAVNEHVFLLRTENSKWQCWLYLLLSYEPIRKYIHTLASAKAAQPGLNQVELQSVTILIPPSIILNEFESIISSMFKAIIQNLKENQRLSTLRDTLLPKLMSGQINL